MTVAIERAGDEGAAPLLHVEGLTVRFGPLRALEDVDLEIRPGEVVALAGENGAGKSTLVRCIAGDMTPSGGRIFISGRRVTPGPAAVARQGVAVVWQDLALCDNLDVASNLLLGRERWRLLLSESRFHAAAATLLRELGIPLDDTTRNTRTLSGGQRQLLAVARAMRDKPLLLILDEPTAALGVTESAQVEDLTVHLRRQGTTILLVSHNVDQMFRLADRIVILRQGRIVADIDAASAHPDDVVALISGQPIDATARLQLSRLHGLADQLVSADPSSTLPLILSALSAALGGAEICLHLVDGAMLRSAGALGLPAALRVAWNELPFGASGGPVGRTAATEQTVVDVDVRTSPAWTRWRRQAAEASVGSSWSVPVLGASGLTGVITVFRPSIGHPPRDQLDLATLYAGYAANAVERERLLGQVTARNRVLETIREVLETLAGPVPLTHGMVVALEALRDGLQADEVGLLGQDGAGAGIACRAFVDHAGSHPTTSPTVLEVAAEALARSGDDGRACPTAGGAGGANLAVTFAAPGGPTVLVARWERAGTPPDVTALFEDAAHSLSLALEREESERAQQEATALRRSQELQRGFLSRLSHELRTPLTAIRGYASSLMQPDVTWDDESQQRFLQRIAAESSRLGRLVDDLLDFSAIESSVLRLQADWCDLGLVLDAAVACLAPADAARVSVACAPDLPVVWADHDRLEQVFVNLLDNAMRHNPPDTRVKVEAATAASEILVSVTDDGAGLPGEMAAAPFELRLGGRGPTAGAGLGLSIAKGIVDAHGGRIVLERPDGGTRFVVHLPGDGHERHPGPADEREGPPPRSSYPESAGARRRVADA